jgi:hypothetical protein
MPVVNGHPTQDIDVLRYCKCNLPLAEGGKPYTNRRGYTNEGQ